MPKEVLPDPPKRIVIRPLGQPRYSKATLTLDARGLEIRQADGSTSHVRWHDVARVDVEHSGSMATRIEIRGMNGEVFRVTPAIGQGRRMTDLLSLFDLWLPRHVEFYQRRRPRKGTRAGHGAGAVVAGGFGLSLLWVAFEGLSASSAAWWFGPAFASGVIACALWLLELTTFLRWNKTKAQEAPVPCRSTLPKTALPALEALSNGVPTGSPRRFAYPKRMRELSLDKVRQNTRLYLAVTTAVFSTFFPLLWLVHAPFEGALAVAAIAMIWPIAAWFYSRKHLAEVETLLPGLQDQIEVEHLAVWVVRHGKRVPARIVDTPEVDNEMASKNGLNRSRVVLQIGEETVWYDPASMHDVSKPMPEVEDSFVLRKITG